MKNSVETSEVQNELDWEKAIIEYAIDTFPFRDSVEFLPGFEGEEKDVLFRMLESHLIKVGFYYEDMQENLVLFYFKRLEGDHYAVMGRSRAVQVEIPSDVDGIFRLDDEQYMGLMDIHSS